MNSTDTAVIFIIVLSALLIVSAALGVSEFARKPEQERTSRDKAFVTVQSVFLAFAAVVYFVALYVKYAPLKRYTAFPLAMGGIGQPSAHTLHRMMF